MESEEFLLLPAAQLIDIVSSDELNVRSEEQTFQAVMSWVKYNVAERRQHLAQVWKHRETSSPSSIACIHPLISPSSSPFKPITVHS